MYYVYGVNSMGCTWYLSSPDADKCTLWSGAPKEYRATYATRAEAEAKIAQLDHAHRFGSTRHHVQKA